MQSLSDRLALIYSDSLEETVKSLLQSLGKLNRPYLTAVEEKLLSLIEKEYGINEVAGNFNLVWQNLLEKSENPVILTL